MRALLRLLDLRAWLVLIALVALFPQTIASDVPLVLTVRGRSLVIWAPVRHSALASDPDLATPPPTAPDRRHLFGTDDRGRDLLARLVYGLRTSLVFGLGCWLCAAALGYALGTLQGACGGIVDILLQRLTEVGSSLPFLHVVLCLECLFRPSLGLLMAVWIAFGWVPFAAYARAEALRARQSPFLLAARAAGIRRGRLIWRHLLPHTLTPLWAVSPLWVGSCIASLTALDFLGVGLPAPTPSWGELLRQGRDNLQCWWLVVFPLAALIGLVAVLYALGERQRARGRLA